MKVLSLLAKTPLEPGQDRMTVKQVLAKVDSKLVDAKSEFAVEDRTPDVVGSTQVATARNDSLMDALEAIPLSTDATWYPWGRTLLIRQKADFIRDRLQNKTTTRRFNGVDVGQVLSELQSIAGVDFVMEPGSIQRIPPESRNLRLVLDNASISQALDNIAGFTGLAWNVSDKGVYIWNPCSRRRRRGQSRADDRAADARQRHAGGRARIAGPAGHAGVSAEEDGSEARRDSEDDDGRRIQANEQPASKATTQKSDEL